ncbi:hypothetical protein DFH08DRAFT_961980 [Mycena albidolilacea]|uniref:Uncharacterized protein n=1 Tax=Mycena albidolilacea TaxID=1033008 RepID=A0AAD7ER57_9AGAR|nr:hypothetical protein DFH08DRAFT_961980 [Mycena albidolilacea]
MGVHGQSLFVWTLSLSAHRLPDINKLGLACALSGWGPITIQIMLPYRNSQTRLLPASRLRLLCGASNDTLHTPRYFSKLRLASYFRPDSTPNAFRIVVLRRSRRSVALSACRGRADNTTFLSTSHVLHLTWCHTRRSAHALFLAMWIYDSRHGSTFHDYLHEFIFLSTDPAPSLGYTTPLGSSRKVLNFQSAPCRRFLPPTVMGTETTHRHRAPGIAMYSTAHRFSKQLPPPPAPHMVSADSPGWISGPIALLHRRPRLSLRRELDSTHEPVAFRLAGQL